jgi:hypothetical protein
VVKDEGEHIIVKIKKIRKTRGVTSIEYKHMRECVWLYIYIYIYIYKKKKTKISALDDVN